MPIPVTQTLAGASAGNLSAHARVLAQLARDSGHRRQGEVELVGMEDVDVDDGDGEQPGEIRR